MNNSLSRLRLTAKTSFGLLRMVWDFDKKILLGSLTSVSLTAIIPFANAYIYKLIIALVIASTGSVTFNFNQLYLLIGLRVFIQILQSSAYNLQDYASSLLWTRFPTYLYQKVLGKISNLDVPHFEISDLKNQLEKVRDSYAWKPINVITNTIYSFQGLFQVLLSVVAIIYLNWYLVIPIIISALFRLWIQTKMAETSWGIWSDRSPYRKKYWYLSDLIQSGNGIKELKAFQLAPHFLNELTELYEKFAKENLSLAKKEFLQRSASSLFDLVAFMGVEIYIIFSAIAKRLTIGEVTYYTTIILNFQNGISGLFRNLSYIYENSLYVKDIFDLLATKAIIEEPHDGIKITCKDAPLIEFKGVSFKYPDSQKFALKNFNLTIKPGQKIALVGENGAGKSTIVKLLARFYDVTDGQILINGHDIKSLDLKCWHKALGILFQDYLHYEYSLSDNIYFGRIFEDKDSKQIVAAAKESGADKVASGLPSGYDQQLGKTFEGGTDLSVGQWQKVALARGFLRNSGTLILDEPTSAIDAKAEYEIFKKVEKLSKNKTVIIISHRFSTVRSADTIYVIGSGGIIESGTHQELLEKNGIYHKLFKLQAKGYQ